MLRADKKDEITAHRMLAGRVSRDGAANKNDVGPIILSVMALIFFE